MFDSYQYKLFKEILFILLLFWIPLIFLVYLDLYFLSILLFLLIVFIIRIRRPYHLISLYIYFLPLSSLISTEHNLFTYVGFNEIIQVFILIFLIQFYKRKKFKFKLNLNRYVKYIIILIASYYLIATTKGILTSHWGYVKLGDIDYIFRLFIKLVFKYLPLILLLNLFSKYKIRSHIYPAIILSVCTIVASMLFVEQLNSFGFLLAENEYALNEVEGGVLRATGFYGAGGDTNSVSGFLLVIFSFYLSQYEITKKLSPYFLILLISVSGVFLTASRTGFICLCLILAIFFIRNYSNRSILKFIPLALLSIFLLAGSIKGTIERFNAESAARVFDSSEDARIGYYFIYGRGFTCT